MLRYNMSGGAASGVDGDGYVGKGIQGFTVTLCLKERRCAGRIAFSERYVIRIYSLWLQICNALYTYMYTLSSLS